MKRSPIRSRSEKRERLMREFRVPIIKELIERGHRCEIGPVLAHAGIEQGRLCKGRIEGLHELRKRSSGGSLINPKNLVPACNKCNQWCEEWPKLAHELGLVVRPGDPLWDELGKRNDS